MNSQERKGVNDGTQLKKETEENQLNTGMFASSLLVRARVKCH